MPNLYGAQGPITCPDFGQDIWKGTLDPLHNINIAANDKNVVFLGLMKASEKPGISPQCKGLLEYLLFQSIHCTGMNTITLADQVVQAYHCPLHVLAELTSTTTTVKSWAAYRKIIQTYLIKVENIADGPQKEEKIARATDSFWCFACEFESGVFHELSFIKNKTLCILLAVILAYANRPGSTVHDAGPIVQGFTSIRGVQPGEDDFDLGFVIYHYLRENFLTAPVGQLAKLMEAEGQ